MVTGATLNRRHYFADTERLSLLQNTLLSTLTEYEWQPESWAVFANHYHVIAKSPDNGKKLKATFQRLHSQASRELNKLDKQAGRKIWFQYWDSLITFEDSYYPRLNYVNNNPVKHGLVGNAELYPFCSAAWFRANAEPGYYRKVSSYRYDNLEIEDDY